jgi:hypothetical protein
MKREYHEGKDATERFEKLATQLFRAPKKVYFAARNRRGISLGQHSRKQ